MLRAGSANEILHAQGVRRRAATRQPGAWWNGPVVNGTRPSDKFRLGNTHLGLDDLGARVLDAFRQRDDALLRQLQPRPRLCGTEQSGTRTGG